MKHQTGKRTTSRNNDNTHSPSVNRLNTWQFNFLNELRATNARNVVLKASRQSGKSTIATWLTTDILLRDPNAYIWYTLPFYKQCAELFKNKFIPYLNSIGVKYSANKSNFSINLYNGSYIQFNSVENYQGLRGATLTDLICDEFAFFRPEAYDYALSPMMDVRGRRNIFISTPRGKNHFYDFYQRGVNGVDGWLSFTGHYSQCDNEHQIKLINEKKLTMLPEVFRQEYDAEFVDKSGQVFKDIQNAFLLEDFALPTAKNFAGIDIGMENDRTVITVINEHGHVIYFKRFEVSEQLDPDYLVNSLLAIIGMFPNVQTYVEKNFNPAIFTLMRKRNNKVYYFNTTNDSKTDLVTNLQYYMSAGLFLSPNIPILIDEMLNYEIGTTKVNNKFTFNAPAGCHDDCIISAALACILHRNLTKSKIITEA